MKFLNREQAIRLSLVLVIFLAGAAMIPFVDLPVGAINWSSLAGAYAPELKVNESIGAPGSIFAFEGSGYPPLSLAKVYANGLPVGSVTTDDDGSATFMIETTGAYEGIYNVTMEVDINASATTSIELEDGQPLVMPPGGFEGPTFSIGDFLYLPAILRQ
jgi:hypothetical protein